MKVAHSVLLALAIAVVALLPPAAAVEPDEILADKALEARARDISRNLRCLVCQNQSIDDSNADLARDLRVLVRERLTAGETNDQVVAFIAARYGDFVLLRPPFKPITWLLWLGPAILLLLGAVAVVVWFRRRAGHAEQPPLSDDEERALHSLLDDEGER
jgi:cytochrome c-type biogenesis protein CcmH